MNDIPKIIGRRNFLELGITSAAALCVNCGKSENSRLDVSAAQSTENHEAGFYEKLHDNLVRCALCPRECLIEEGARGFCGTRENSEGTLYSLVYGNVVAKQIDPIEKKPLYHFLPGSEAYSIATAGCNMTCKFCQNWQISQSKPEELRSSRMSPQDVAAEAVAYKSKSIAYTYNEPTVFTEFMYDCATEGNASGVRSVVISNGYINPEPLEKLCEVISAYKVDLKAFSDSFYRDITGGQRNAVLDTIKRLKKNGVWTELVHLTIPTLNDNDVDFRAMGDWLMAEIGPDIPVHFTRFHPTYRLLNLPVTPVSTLERARNILMEKGLKFVYVGNVPGHDGNSTYCPGCRRILIKRAGYSVDISGLKNGKCNNCGINIPGVWS
ncbi:AmmeMemoRadiSam system radical SAM enzyme [Candidatus Latescibacterota bacterium]